jgi:large subunit ribosomal protein L22
MGARKKLRAESIKEANKGQYFAIMRNCPTSPRKMRLVADMIRGVDVLKALDILKFSSKEASIKMEKLLKSALSNWEAKNDGKRPEEHNLIVKTVQVDAAGMLKRYRPAPQGRAHRIRKRSNHVTLYIDSKEIR